MSGSAERFLRALDPEVAPGIGKRAEVFGARVARKDGPI